MSEDNVDNQRQYLTSINVKESFPFLIERLAHDQEGKVLKLEELINETREFMCSFQEQIRNDGVPTDIFFLLKSAIPVGRMFRKLWPHFYPDTKIPKIHYVNIGRAAKTDEVVTYNLKTNSINTYEYDPEIIAPEPSQIAAHFPNTGKKIFVIDECSRTGDTIDIAGKVFRVAFPQSEVTTKVVYSKQPHWYDNPGYLGIIESTLYDKEFIALQSLNRKFGTDFQDETEMMGDSRIGEMRKFYLGKIDTLNNSVHGITVPADFDVNTFNNALKEQDALCEAILQSEAASL